MKALKIVLILFAGFISYVILINIISYNFSAISGMSVQTDGQAYSQDGGDIKIGISDSVDVTVVRHRWYGTIVNGADNSGSSSNLYLLSFIKLPLRSNGKSMLFAHLAVIALIVICMNVIIRKINRNNFERGIF